jgi:hypothetical protein
LLSCLGPSYRTPLLFRRQTVLYQRPHRLTRVSLFVKSCPLRLGSMRQPCQLLRVKSSLTFRTFALESRVTAEKRIQAKRLVWATQTKVPLFRMPRRLHPRHPPALRKNQGTTGSSQFPLSDGPNLRFLKWNVVAFIQLRQPLLAQTSSCRHLPRLTSSSHRRKVFSMLEMPACSHTVRAPLKAIFAWW